MEITLDVQPRTETGKGPARRFRAAGLVPAIFYGPSVEPVPLLVDAKQMSQALHTEAGGNVLINLTVNGEARLTIPREVQRHPIRGDILHVDFVNVARDQAITAHVPVHTVGDAPGVKLAGGVMEQHLYELHVEAVPSAIPSALELDLSTLGMNESIKAADVPLPADVTLLTPGDEVVVAVGEPKGGLAEEEAEAGEAIAEEGEAAPGAASEEASGAEES